MACFYKATVEKFLAESDDVVLASLELGYAHRGYTSQYTDQTLAWQRDLRSIRETLERCAGTSASAMSWCVLLEFSIPRKEMRIDLVLLVKDTVVVLEAKSGHTGSPAKRQVEEYALLLHYFHKQSVDCRIVPIVVSSVDDNIKPNLTRLNQRELFSQLPTYWIAPVMWAGWEELPDLLMAIENPQASQISIDPWDESPYFPVPSIMEAALALKSGLSIREIAHSEASEHEIGVVEDAIRRFISEARSNHHHAICFLTGVPGSGKTLVGLSLAHSDQARTDAIHFMSGNGPLVQVLQYLFIQESKRRGASSPQAHAEAKALIENVHVFARYYADDNPAAPSNHVVIFDEAQRAWNKKQNMKKFHRDYSEPEMLLRIMERHPDWAVIIALVGGGQEINDGEAGLEEWGRALAASSKDWLIYASPEVLRGGASTAGHTLTDEAQSKREIITSSKLHLRTSNRSLRAEQLAAWVNLALDGKAKEAASIEITARFPIFLTRDLNEMRLRLRTQHLGENRYGLVGSSGATRLRAEGLEPSSTFHAGYPWEHWYLSPECDVRSSYRCEVFATEFEIQGLELDWIGLCWGGDFIWNETLGWQLRALRHGSPSKWNVIKNPERRTFRKNAYRVLLTRARQGMFVYVPRGNPDDPTNNPEEFEKTAQFLIRCGVIPSTQSPR